MEKTSTTTVRDARLDVARGIAIVSVVFVHVYRGLTAAGLVDPSVSAHIDRIVVPYALSVFVFVTGTFVPRGVQKVGVPAYLRDRVTRFVIVYIVWTLLQGSVQLLAADAVNAPPSPLAVLALWRPIGHLWYLPFLILALVIFVPMQPWVRQRAPWILGATAVVSVLFWGSDFQYVGTQGLALLVYFVGGMAIGSDRVRAVLDRFSRGGAGLLGLAIFVGASALALATHATSPTYFWDGRTPFTVAMGVAVSLALSGAVFLLGHCLQSVSILATFGRRSLEIYLAHILMASGTRIVLTHLGVTSLWILVPACIAAGIFGSLLLGTLLRRVGLGWVFDGPAWMNSASRKKSSRRAGGAAQA